VLNLKERLLLIYNVEILPVPHLHVICYLFLHILLDSCLNQEYKGKCGSGYKTS
jgi:hypothetical protein